MSLRFYVTRWEASTHIPGSTAPKTANALPADHSWRSVIGNDGNAGYLGFGLFFSDVTDPEHALLEALPQTTYLPFETGAGVVLSPSAQLSEVSAANRTQISTLLENNHIPTDDFTGTMTIRQALKRVVKRFIFRQIVDLDDFTEALDDLISTIPAQKRQNFSNKLTARGFDLSGITGSMTVRQGLKELFSQVVDGSIDL